MSEINAQAPETKGSGQVVRTISTFHPNRRFYDTHRFGEYHPFEVMEGVPKDTLSLLSAHNVRSFNMKSPLLQDIMFKKDVFLVPRQAILPRNWSKIEVNPAIGEDVPDDVNSIVEDFFYKAFIGFQSNRSRITSQWDSLSGAFRLQATIKLFLFWEMFFSNGSLLSSLGIHGSPYLRFKWYVDPQNERDPYYWSFDKYMDSIFNTRLEPNIGRFNVHFEYQASDEFYQVHVNDTNYSDDMLSSQDDTYIHHITFRQFLSLARENMMFYIDTVYDNPNGMESWMDASAGVYNDLLTSTFVAEYVFTVSPTKKYSIDLARAAAYQIACAHFYTDDHLDYIYSAELYRQLLDSYITDNLNYQDGQYPTFKINGYTYLYDALSGKLITDMLTLCSGSTSGLPFTVDVDSFYFGETTGEDYPNFSCFNYFVALLAYRRSLRYQDYFVGSRSQPLAVGDVNVAVNQATGKFSVVDVTKNIQRQRFFNFVNRIPRKTEEYVQELFGINVAPDYNNPFWVGHTTDTVYGSEIENTGTAQMNSQNSTTSVLRSNGSRFMFDINCDRSCIVIGIAYYDISRAYTESIDRQVLHRNRFDMFNPFMQFIGDQDIKQVELSPRLQGNGGVFGYENRNMEYKLRFDIASGGFVENLPSWSFKNLIINTFGSIDSEFIRSNSGELDQFFQSLTGYSLGSYFHFIVVSTNNVDARRPMAYAPSIL